MSRTTTKPENVLIAAVRHLQAARQHHEGVRKGHYPNDTLRDSMRRCNAARARVDLLINRYTRVIDFKRYDEEKKTAIIGH